LSRRIGLGSVAVARAPRVHLGVEENGGIIGLLHRAVDSDFEIGHCLHFRAAGRTGSPAITCALESIWLETFSPVQLEKYSPTPLGLGSSAETSGDVSMSNELLAGTL